MWHVPLRGGAVTKLRILGPTQLWVAGRQLDLGPVKQRTVLAALLVDAGRAVSVETLIDRVWPDGPPSGVRSGLYSYIAKLRRVLAQARDEFRQRRGQALLLAHNRQRCLAQLLRHFRFNVAHS